MISAQINSSSVSYPATNVTNPAHQELSLEKNKSRLNALMRADLVQKSLICENLDIYTDLKNHSTSEVNRSIYGHYLVSSSTAPDIIKVINDENDAFLRYIQESVSNLSDAIYLGLVEVKALAGAKKSLKASAFRELENTVELSSYLLSIYALETEKKHRAASKVIYKFIETNFAASNLFAVNALLDTIDLQQLSEWSISGLVRFTGRARSQLPCWDATFRKAKKVLTEKGFDSDKLLAGITG